MFQTERWSRQRDNDPDSRFGVSIRVIFVISPVLISAIQSGAKDRGDWVNARMEYLQMTRGVL